MITQEYVTLHREASSALSTVISRRFLFPHPVATDKFTLTVLEGDEPLVFKMDLLGMPPEKKYAVDPILDPIKYKRDFDGNRLEENWNFEADEIEGTEICPHGSIYLRLFSGDNSGENTKSMIKSNKINTLI